MQPLSLNHTPLGIPLQAEQSYWLPSVG